MNLTLQGRVPERWPVFLNLTKFKEHDSSSTGHSKTSAQLSLSHMIYVSTLFKVYCVEQKDGILYIYYHTYNNYYMLRTKMAVTSGINSLKVDVYLCLEEYGNNISNMPHILSCKYPTVTYSTTPSNVLCKCTAGAEVSSYADTILGYRYLQIAKKVVFAIVCAN